MKNLPFSLVKRKNIYYVRLKKNGKPVSWKSTKEKNYDKALEKAFEIFAESKQSVEKAEKRMALREQNLSDEELQYFLDHLQKSGKIKTFVISNSPQDIKAFDYAMDFWDKEKSEYLKSKTRKGYEIFSQHLTASKAYLKNYWEVMLGTKLLGELTRNDIKEMFTIMDTIDKNGNTKNHIMRALLTPLKYAYHNDLIKEDLFSGWTFYKTEYKKKKIIPFELAKELFKKDWECPVAKLANMLAACTGMRIGEIMALSPNDIGDGYIHIRYSYNNYDKLKCTKNGEERIEQVVFTPLLNYLRAYGYTNPFDTGRMYIFYSTIPDKPMEQKFFTRELRKELTKLGLSKEDAKEYTFHSWRHFYTSYMIGKIEDKLLQSQTGHKTLAMLQFYGSHETDGDIKKIQDAQNTVFSDLFSFN